ncbi:unnamed protein product [Sphenostylis stenocarpa]|uniref:DUF7086 domain-containing protein n=1 Tax=Sphenostylis stenocarpa TaxID=92480 RepID=A0AA86TFP9_9FABA|nr:unnamed protein product [Sphenostylis stenocarpa]
MKNSMVSEENIDLTLTLSLGPAPPVSHPPTHPPETNLSVMDMSMLFPDPNPNPLFASSSNNNNITNLSLVSSSSIDTDNPPNADEDISTAAPSTHRYRRRPSNRRSRGEDETIPPPFPWATDRQATIHCRQYLLENNICTITGTVHCRTCEQEFQLSLDLEEKAAELRRFIQRRKDRMHDRAPAAWLNPVFPKCALCGQENSIRPVIAEDKKQINWLFLLLGQMLGCCTLDHLKHFCKFNGSHRTGAKDRLLYLTYMKLAEQLQPQWFDS